MYVEQYIQACIPPVQSIEQRIVQFSSPLSQQTPLPSIVHCSHLLKHIYQLEANPYSPDSQTESLLAHCYFHFVTCSSLAAHRYLFIASCSLLIVQLLFIGHYSFSHYLFIDYLLTVIHLLLSLIFFFLRPFQNTVQFLVYRFISLPLHQLF